MVNVSVSGHDIVVAAQAVHDATLLSMNSSREAVEAVMEAWGIRYDYAFIGGFGTWKKEERNNGTTHSA